MIKPPMIEHDGVFVVAMTCLRVGPKPALFRCCLLAPTRLSMQARPRAARKLLLPR